MGKLVKATVRAEEMPQASGVLRIVQQAMTCFLKEVAGILEEGGYQYWLDSVSYTHLMGELVTKTLYSSNITTDEEVLVEASRRMLNSGDPQGALELLEDVYKRQTPTRSLATMSSTKSSRT